MKQAREKIRTEINKNFFVEAGAGSGKTTVLVDRMVAMVEGGVDISKICAITFTKAAAGEFYARFQKKLSESDSPKAAEALKNIDLCFMGTIDSFCNMVLSEHPAKAGIPSNSQVAGDKEMEAAYKTKYSQILRGMLGDERLKSKAERFAGTFANDGDIFARGIRMLSSVKNAKLICHRPPGGRPDDIFASQKLQIIRVLSYLLEHPEIVETSKPLKAAKSWAALADSLNTIRKSWNYRLSSVHYALKALGDLRIRPEAGDLTKLDLPELSSFFVPHESRGKTAWFEIDEISDPFLINRLGNLRFEIAIDFISDCVEVVSKALRAEGRLTYTDYLLYLRDMLAEDASEDGRLIEHIYNRHSYFVIDEFQDTNPLQAEIFFYITAKEPKPCWHECEPRDGSLFIVGDPKQSIYRFRNADVESFDRVKRLFKNPNVGEVLYLTRNFRSTDKMCSLFNEIFSEMMNPIPTGEKPAYEGSLEGMFSYEVPVGRGADRNEDARAVARIIGGLVSNPDITIQDRGGRLPRRVNYEDIMVITPTKGRMSLIMNALAAAGIPFRIEGRVLFDECPALKAIWHIMRAIASPDDRQAMYGAINISGCSLTEERVRAYINRAASMSSAAVFMMILEDEEVLARVSVQNAEYLYFALELLRTAEIEGQVASLSEGAAFIGRLASNESEEERCIQLRRDKNCVHLANLHKVKGLEAPIVILADPQRRNMPPDMRVDYSQNPPVSYIFDMGAGLATSDFEEEKEAEAHALKQERDRLLYVAATRAENTLIVADGIKSDGKSSDANPWAPLLRFCDSIESRLSGYSIIRELFNSNEETGHIGAITKGDDGCGLEDGDADPYILYQRGRESSVLKYQEPLEKSYEIRRPSEEPEKAPNDIQAHDESSAEVKAIDSDLDSRPYRNPLVLGTMVHRLMEALVSSKDEIDRDSLIIETLNECGEEDSIYEETLREICDAMRGGGYPQEGHVPEDILSTLLNAKEVYCELPFCYMEDDKTICNGVIDVVYLDDRGWHIVDYKTNAQVCGLEEHYQAQLDAYAKAFKIMTGNDADASIYHIKK